MAIAGFLELYVFGPSGFWTMAPLRCAAKFDPFLPFLGLRPHALRPGAIQGKEGIKFCHLATLPLTPLPLPTPDIICTCPLSRDTRILVAAPRKDGACPLFIAAQSGYAECARLLLEAGAEVDQTRLVRYSTESIAIQGPAKEWFPSCENFSGKARQKW